MTEDRCAEARARVQRWEMEVEALQNKRDRAAMGKTIGAGVLRRLDGELDKAKGHLAEAEAELVKYEAAG